MQTRRETDMGREMERWLGAGGCPMARSTLGAPGVAVAGSCPASTGAGAVVLVADDDPDFRGLAARCLTQAGLQVLQAHDGPEVFRLLERGRPDLILLDCGMPGLDGFDVCRRLTESPLWSDVPVIFVTALARPQDKRRGFEVGGVDYVTKPIDVAELLARIRHHLELAAIRRLLRCRADLLKEAVADKAGRSEEIRSGQVALLTRASTFPELNLALRYQPANVAGGDFYEVARLTAAGVYGLLVMDVSGHDLSVPFITGALKALAATFLKDALTPQETMLLMNASLCSFLPPNYYVTACYLKYSRERMEVEVVSAAHPPVLHQTATGELHYVSLVGDVLGILEQAQFESRKFPVRPGERLLLYTDGLIESYPTESRRCGSALWGMQRLAEEMARRRGMPLQAAVDGVVDGLVEECGEGAGDDIVALGIEF